MSKKLDPETKDFRRRARRAFERVLKTNAARWVASSDTCMLQISAPCDPVMMGENLMLQVTFTSFQGAVTFP